MVRAFTAEVEASNITDYRAHGLSRPPITEALATAEVYELGAGAGCPVHIVHCSIGRGYELAAAYRAQGHAATIEACIHYLTLDEENDVRRLGGKAKINPPLRSRARSARRCGIISPPAMSPIVSTDHVSWSEDRKTDPNMLKNASGVPGLEVLYALLLKGLDERGLPLTHAARLLGAQSGQRCSASRHVKGALAVGRDADIVLCGAIPIATARPRAATISCPGAPMTASNCRFAWSATFLRGDCVAADGQRDWPSPGRVVSSSRRYRCTERRRNWPRPICRSMPTRLWADVMALAEITDPERPYTRRSFTPLFLEGRAWLARRFAEAGLAVRIDTAGNLIGRLDGADPALGVIAIGSHSDTVPSRRSLRRHRRRCHRARRSCARCAKRATRLRHPIEVIDFLAEEPSEYGLSCVGSRGMAGALDAAMLDLTDPSGETLRDALRRVGGDPGSAAPRRSVTDIERLPRTAHRAGHRAGIPSRSMSASSPRSSASGASRSCSRARPITPAPRRWLCASDALVAAANTVASVRRIAEQLAGEGNGLFRRHRRHTDGRAGRRQCHPRPLPPGDRCAHHRSGADGAFRRGDRTRERGACRRGAREARGRSRRCPTDRRSACDPTAARRASASRASARLERNRSRQRRRARRGLHEPHLPVGHDFRALPRRQEPRAGGMGGSRADRCRRSGCVASGQGARSIASIESKGAS